MVARYPQTRDYRQRSGLSGSPASSLPTTGRSHSCAAMLNGQRRPWHIGLARGDDVRLSRPLLAEFSVCADLVIGDNEPYALESDVDFTIPRHAMRRGLAYLQVEFRNDLLRTATDAQRLADRFVDVLERLGDRPEWHEGPACCPGSDAYGIAESAQG
jgi:predicted N-formylglutamate amidohydrolase